MTADAGLCDGQLSITGRVMPASNATFFGEIDGVEVVYKPIAGERPLWDFPAGSLAHREVGSHLVCQALGWEIVPTTWLGDGEFGPGMIQLWKHADPDQTAVTLVPAGQLPDSPAHAAGWKHVFDGLDQDRNRVWLIHEDSEQLRRMAIFDAIVNNADRKGSHILEMPGTHRFGIDHGLTFHSEHKLRTILWGWADEGLLPDELQAICNVTSALSGQLGSQLADLLTQEEIEAVSARCDQLTREARFPEPHGRMPAIPWPPL